jgi:hypothetical protein
MRGHHGGVERLGRVVTSRRQILFTAACALMLTSVVAAEPPATKVEWRESRLSVTAEKADVVIVLEAVQAKTGLEVQGLERLRGLPDGKRMISVTFENLPLADGLSTLLSGFSFGLVEFYKPKPGTPGVMLYVATQGGIPSRAKDEPGAESQQSPAASVTVRAEDESGAPIAPADAPEQPRQRTPSRREDEPGAGAQQSRAASVSVHAEDESGAPIASAAAPERPRAVSPPQMRPDERRANEAAQQQNSRPGAPEK